MDKIIECKLMAVTFEISCGWCESINYIRDSGFEDSSKIDPEGITCWNCGKDSFFDTTIELKRFMSPDVALKDQSFLPFDGKKSPKGFFENE